MDTAKRQSISRTAQCSIDQRHHDPTRSRGSALLIFFHQGFVDNFNAGLSYVFHK